MLPFWDAASLGSSKPHELTAGPLAAHTCFQPWRTDGRVLGSPGGGPQASSCLGAVRTSRQPCLSALSKRPLANAAATFQATLSSFSV